VKFHYSRRAIELIEQVWANVLHIPAYSLDFNLIEECISKIKALLRRQRPEQTEYFGQLWLK
jgi:hypothetical protein